MIEIRHVRKSDQVSYFELDKELSALEFEKNVQEKKVISF